MSFSLTSSNSNHVCKRSVLLFSTWRDIGLLCYIFFIKLVWIFVCNMWRKLVIKKTNLVKWLPFCYFVPKVDFLMTHYRKILYLTEIWSFFVYSNCKMPYFSEVRGLQYLVAMSRCFCEITTPASSRTV